MVPLWLDVILFATGAFAGTPGYLSIMQGTLISRLVITLFACPFLWAYLNWQQIELYIQQRSDAQFSHGICPECARSLYPELELGEST